MTTQKSQPMLKEDKVQDLSKGRTIYPMNDEIYERGEKVFQDRLDQLMKERPLNVKNRQEDMRTDKYLPCGGLKTIITRTKPSINENRSSSEKFNDAAEEQQKNH